MLAVHGVLLGIYHHPEPKTLAGDEQTYSAAAGRLSAGRPARLDPLWPPLYPHFLAALRRLGAGPVVGPQAAQLLLLVIAAGLLRDLTRRSTGSATAGDLAAFLLLVYPPLVAFAHYLWPEVLHLTLMLAALWVIAARGERWRWMPVLGALLGALLLTKSLLGPFLPVLLLPLAFQGRRFAPRAGRIALALAVLAVTVAPTMLANRETTGRLMIADSSRFNLWVGLNDRSRKSLEDSIVGDEYLAWKASAPNLAERDALLEHKIGDHLRREGLVKVLRGQLGKQYFRLFDKDSYLTDQLPGGDLHAIGQGYRSTPPWLARTLRFASYSLYALVLLGAAIGAALLADRRHPWLLWVLAFLGYNLVIFLALHVKSRYRVQMLPFLFLLASGAFAGWREGTGPFAPGSAPRWRWAIAGAFAAVLWMLAFAGPVFGR